MKRKEVKFSVTKRGEKGFSLIELLIVCVILLFVLGMMATIVASVQSSYRTFRERSAKHNDALAAMNLITRIIRNAGDNTTQTPLVATGSNRLQIVSDWATTDNTLNDRFENVEFYVLNNALYLKDNNLSPSEVELAPNIQSINFAYFDVNGANTTVMTNVAMVRVTLTIIGESQPLMSNVIVRGKIQPK